jgi:hypothetical protein
MRALQVILGGITACVIGFAALATPHDGMLRPLSREAGAAILDAAAQVDPSTLRPESRPLAMIRTAIIVQTGAALRPVTRIDFRPDARWDSATQRAEDWTAATVAAIRAAPHDLSTIVPRDIMDWCPAYAMNPPHLREAFWVGVISALARHESTFNPRAVGGGGQWYGLLQIYPPTARHFDCGATSGEALTDAEANLECAVRIMSVTVRRDQAVAIHDSRWRGIAADWGPMTSAIKRAEMSAWVRSQDYCTASGAIRMAVVPETRPWTSLVASTEGQLTVLSESTMNYAPDFVSGQGL